MDTVNALTFRQKFGEILDKVVSSGQPIVVERQNKPVVVMYPYEEKKAELEKLVGEERKKQLRKMLDEWTRKWGKSIPGEKTTTDMIRETRDNRFGKRWWKTRSNY